MFPTVLVLYGDDTLMYSSVLFGTHVLLCSPLCCVVRYVLLYVPSVLCQNDILSVLCTHVLLCTRCIVLYRIYPYVPSV
jgi:hypothetical protein